MPSIAKPPYRRGSKKATDMSVGILNGKPVIQVNWGGRIYATQLSLIGAGNVKDSLEVGDIRATGNITFGKNSSVYNNSNRLLMVGGLTTSGDGNMAIGSSKALSSLVGESNNIQNVAIGTDALSNAVNGQYNIAIGIGAMFNVGSNSSETYGDVSANVAIGSGALKGTGTRPQGANNVAIGTASMLNVTSGDDSALTAQYNTCVGAQSGYNLEGQQNVYIGATSGQGAPNNNTGNFNIAVGAYSFTAVTDGTYNTTVGYDAGDTITTGDYNICIGYQADVDAADAQNRVAIGKSITCTADNTTLIGNTDIILQPQEGGECLIDQNISSTDAGTYKGLAIDVDKTGSSTTNNSIYGLDICVDNTTATDGINTIFGIHVDNTLEHAANAGTAINYGIAIAISGDTSGTSVGTGISLDVSGHDINNGITIDADTANNDWDIKCIGDSNDYFKIRCSGHGVTTFTTVDDAAEGADLIFNIDGYVDVNSASGENITLDSGGDIILDAAGSNITLYDNGSTYTPSGASGATTKRYVDSHTVINNTSYARANNTTWYLFAGDQTNVLGGSDTSVSDTETVFLGRSLLDTLWFIVPYDTTVHAISGSVCDDDMSAHLDKYIGIWTIDSLSTSGDDPGDVGGSQAFTLRYITAAFGGSIASIQAFHDTGADFELTAGQGVFLGYINGHSGGLDDVTLNCTIWSHHTTP